MAYIITRLCRDCVDTACVAVCPVDCIYRYSSDDHETFPNQLYIHPDECIDCGACEPECPWQAIFEEVAVPEVFQPRARLYFLRTHEGLELDGLIVAGRRLLPIEIKAIASLQPAHFKSLRRFMEMERSAPAWPAGLYGQGERCCG